MSEQNGRVPPYDLNAERAILGAVLIENDTLAALAEILTPADFYSPAHGLIYQAMIDLRQQKRPIDVLILSDWLKFQKKLKDAGGTAYLADLADGTPTAALAAVHAQIVRDAAERRRDIEMHREAIEKLYARDVGLSEIREQVKAALARPAAGAAASSRSPITIKISDVEREEVKWLWHGRIALGKLTMIEGDPGVGKSWLTLAISTAVSRGLPLPGDVSRRAPANVILMSAEDGLGDTVRPRLEDMGADLTRVIAVRGIVDSRGREDVLTLADLDILERVIADEKPRLVIIDPIIAFAAGKDTSKASEVRGLLAPVAALAEKHSCAIVCVRHLNKGAGKALYRGQGTVDFTALCRSAFLVGEDPDNADDRILCHIKNTVLAKTASLIFTIDKGQFCWKGESSLTADQVLALPESDEKRTEQDDAKEFLRTLLADSPMGSAEVMREASKAGISERTLWRAKTALKVKATKKGFGKSGGWVWSMDQAAEPHSLPHTLPKDASFSGVADMAALAKSGSLSAADTENDGWEDLT